MARRLRTAFVVFLLMAGTVFAAPRSARLTVLHTSDLHGSVLPWDDAADRPARGSLAQVATVVARVRKAVDHPVLLFDSGDALQGTPLELFTHVRWQRPSPTIGAMNRIGYLAMAVGNHEFNFGLRLLDDARKQARFPFLSANVIDEATGKPRFRPYIVLEREGIRIGVLGLTTPNIPGWEMPDHYRGLSFEPMDEAARKWVPILRGTERCDLVIVLAHTGFERDPETGRPEGGDVENFAWRLAHVPGIDLLLTGHTHRNIPPRMLDGVIVSQPGSHARFVTRIDLEMTRKHGRWSIAHWSGENIPVRDVPPDPGIEAAFREDHERLVAELERPVGQVVRDVTVKGCRLHDCAALDLIHAVQLEASGAQLSLASLLTDRTPDLPAGPVTWRWVYALYVYPNTLVAVRLTGRQVLDLLEHSARFYDGIDCCPGPGCVVLTDPNVRHYNVDTIEGLTYRIDPTAPEGHRIRDVRYEGRPLAPDASFTLVCNNYRAAGGGGFPHLQDAPVVWRSSRSVTELIGEYLERHRPWLALADGNWYLAPPLTGARRLPAETGADKVSP